jgi:hypothetical protein
LGKAAEDEGRTTDALVWYRKASAQHYPAAIERLKVLDAGVETAQPEASPPLKKPAPVDPRVTLFVGPAMRDGFVDIDSGVLDSIKDIKTELEGKRTVRVVIERDLAQVRLDVMSRGATSSAGGGAVAAPIGSTTFLIPIGTIGIATVLHVGSYEKQIVFQNCQAWRYCARLVAKDVEAWVEANRATLDESRSK